jgi:hypothetical protein
MQVCYNTNDMFRKRNKCCNCGFLGLLSPIPLGLMSVQTMQDVKAAQELHSNQECIQEGRDRIADGTHSATIMLACTRNVWSSLDFKDKPKDVVFQYLNSYRKCPYFFPYNTGYSPIEHRELQREAKSQRLLIIGMLLAALIAAVAAIVAQVLAR